MTTTAARYVRHLLWVSLLVPAVGCHEATLIRSTPDNARVYIDGHFVGLTPMRYVIPRSALDDPLQYRIEHDDYETEEGRLGREVSGGRVFSGLITLGVSWFFKGPTTLQDRHDFALQPVPPPPLRETSLSGDVNDGDHKTLCLQASPELNWYDEKAHSLAVRIYVLSSLAGFWQTSVDTLTGERVAFAGITGPPQEEIIAPGEQRSVSIGVSTDAKFIGVAARYEQLKGRSRVYRSLESTDCVMLGPDGLDL